MTYAERVRAHLAENKISQAWLCRQTGLKFPAMSRWLSEGRKMPVEAAIKISKVLNLPIIEEDKE